MKAATSPEDLLATSRSIILGTFERMSRCPDAHDHRAWSDIAARLEWLARETESRSEAPIHARAAVCRQISDRATDAHERARTRRLRARWLTCEACAGTGVYSELEDCHACGGAGEVPPHA